MLSQKYEVIILDISNCFYRSYTAFDLCNSNGEDISGIVGCLSTIQSQIKINNPNLVIGVFDGKGGANKKRKLLQNYKEKRTIPVKLNYFAKKNLDSKIPIDTKVIAEQTEIAKKNFFWQLRKLNEFLSFLPVYRIVAEGYEADEIIAYLSEKCYKNNKKLIISADKDYHQLVDDNLHIWNFKSIVDKEYIKKYWGTEYGNIISVIRSIDGDKSDNVDGIFGYGIKSINNFFKPLLDNPDIKNIEDFIKELKLLSDKIQNEKKEYSANWKTIVSKINALINGIDKYTNKPCVEILKRNFEIMQLNEPNISLHAKEIIHGFLNSELEFVPGRYKMMIIEEGMNLQGNSLMDWELQYRNLRYNQIQMKKNNV